MNIPKVNGKDLEQGIPIYQMTFAQARICYQGVQRAFSFIGKFDARYTAVPPYGNIHKAEDVFVAICLSSKTARAISFPGGIYRLGDKRHISSVGNNQKLSKELFLSNLLILKMLTKFKKLIALS